MNEKEVLDLSNILKKHITIYPPEKLADDLACILIKEGYRKFSSEPNIKCIKCDKIIDGVSFKVCDDCCKDCWSEPNPSSGMTKDDIEYVAEEIIGHIDLMYPDMWKAVAKTARKSIKNTIINQLSFKFSAKPKSEPSNPNLNPIEINKSGGYGISPLKSEPSDGELHGTDYGNED